MQSLVTVALGGNAVLKRGQEGTFSQQVDNLRGAVRGIISLLKDGHRVVITHGNGPQVGNILIQNELAKDCVPPMPLGACGAQSQGLIGFMCQHALSLELTRQGMDMPVVTVVTRVLIGGDDPALKRPTKPIGPFYTEEQAQEMENSLGYTMREDAGRGWRRVVPSPEPQAIMEMPAVASLVEKGAVVIAAGGGGIPVDSSGSVVDAVIDKDLTGALLARQLGASHFVILTDVPAVALGFGTPQQEYIRHLRVEEAERLLQEGRFPEGSMGPKVMAAVRFARNGGTSVIADLDSPAKAVRGEAGTRVTD